MAAIGLRGFEYEGGQLSWLLPFLPGISKQLLYNVVVIRHRDAFVNYLWYNYCLGNGSKAINNVKAPGEYKFQQTKFEENETRNNYVSLARYWIAVLIKKTGEGRRPYPSSVWIWVLLDIVRTFAWNPRNGIWAFLLFQVLSCLFISSFLFFLSYNTEAWILNTCTPRCSYLYTDVASWEAYDADCSDCVTVFSVPAEPAS